VDGQKVFQVRELVRINHHRNCLLCHAPAEDEGSPVRGVVSTPGLPLPDGMSLAYRGKGDEGTFVRADVTYLRQDFSVLLPVEDHKDFDWPQMQRFDFLVRARTRQTRAVKL
jgi:hypothetical protein